MLMGELLSLVQLKLPVKIIVFNNSALGFVELEMKAAGMLDFGTELVATDFSKIAAAIGMLGLRAETPEQVKPMITQALSHDGPALVDVAVNRQELLIPPDLNFEEVRGFTIYMIKAVLNGRGDEIVDLAKTSLFR
jgi:pyruvate dehydrogenase (quinone)